MTSNDTTQPNPSRDEETEAVDRIDATRVEIERPAALVVGRTAEPERDDVLQAEQPAHDDRAVGPRAGLRGDEPVAAGFDRPQGYVAWPVLGNTGVAGDPVREVGHVAVELLAARDVGRAHASIVPRVVER